VSDQGSGTVWMVALMAVIWLAAIGTMVAGGVRAARHRAHAAADGAALAAAARAAEGPAVACRIAAVVATGTGARVTRCTLGIGGGLDGTGWSEGVGRSKGAGSGQTADVSVVVIYRGPAWLGTLRIPARASAGPAMTDPNGHASPPTGGSGDLPSGFP
jgi:secretion/DNA translocation related TadE-like protein